MISLTTCYLKEINESASQKQKQKIYCLGGNNKYNDNSSNNNKNKDNVVCIENNIYISNISHILKIQINYLNQMHENKNKYIKVGISIH